MSLPPDLSQDPQQNLSQPSLAGSAQVTDLLLVLIVSLGSVQLFGPLLVSLLRPDELALAGSTAESDPGAGLMITLVMLTFQTAVMLIALHAFVIRKYGLSWADLGVRPTSRRWATRSAVIGLFMVPLLAFVNATVQSIVGESYTNPQLYALAPGGYSFFGAFLMTVMAGAIVPFVEELAFRGLLYPWLRARIGVTGGIVVSAACFAILHGLPMLIPALFVIGVILATVYERSDSIWPPVIVHGVFNTLMVLALYSVLASGIELPVPQ